jgi:ADP-ribose pyrophosphatase YjhB (NUDIX family)
VSWRRSRKAGPGFYQDPFNREHFRRIAEIADEFCAIPCARRTSSGRASRAIRRPKWMCAPPSFATDASCWCRRPRRSAGRFRRGYADIGLSPAAETTEKECREESGYDVRARIVTSVVDRHQAGFPAHAFAFYKITMLCDLVGGEARTSVESTAVDFFPLTALLPLDLHRTNETEIRRAYAFLAVHASRPPSTDVLGPATSIRFHCEIECPYWLVGLTVPISIMSVRGGRPPLVLPQRNRSSV